MGASDLLVHHGRTVSGPQKAIRACVMDYTPFSMKLGVYTKLATHPNKILRKSNFLLFRVNVAVVFALHPAAGPSGPQLNGPPLSA